MHILISILQGAGMFVLAIIASAAIVGTLFSPVWLGQFVASRANRKLMATLIAVLSAVFVYGAFGLYQSFMHNFHDSYWAMVPFFVPLYMGMGLWIGNENKNRRLRNEAALTNWRNQLAADRLKGGDAVRLAADYRAIGDLLKKLGRNQEAADEYGQAIAILETSLGSHPAMDGYYSEYLAVLSGKANREEVSRIQAKRDALPKLS